MKWLVIICLVLMPLAVFAGTIGEIIKIEAHGDNRPISVWVQYKLDGAEIVSNYPKIDGKSVFRFGADYSRLTGMDKTQIKTYIEDQVGEHCENIIKNKFRDIANDALAVNADVTALVGNVVSKTTGKVYVDTDKNGLIDQEWTVKTDGTKTIKTITEVPELP